MAIIRSVLNSEAHKESNDHHIIVSITIGNSDLLCIVAYTDSEELYRIIAAMKSTHGVSRVWWSEEVYNISGKNYSISSLIQVPKNKSDIMSSSYH